MRFALLAAVSLALATPAFAAAPIATWEFHDTLAADQLGQPALTRVDPAGVSRFSTESVFGESRVVWSFAGGTMPATAQPGLSVGTRDLLDPHHYTLDMVFKFAAHENVWRRLVDVGNGLSEEGLYVGPTNNLELFPAGRSAAAIAPDVFHHLVLTVDGGRASTYVDGKLLCSATTPVLQLDQQDNPGHLLNLFLGRARQSDTLERGNNACSSGSIALLRLWNGVLSPEDIGQLAAHPFPDSTATPLPAAWTSLSAVVIATAAALFARRRRNLPA